MAFTLSDAKEQVEDLKKDLVQIEEDLGCAGDCETSADFQQNIEEAISKANDFVSSLKKINASTVVDDEET